MLAVHLDGDLEQESFDREACEPLGYGFVSDDSLHSHLRECLTCQTALQRARRLDAELASMAGRAVADQVTASGCSMEELGNQWLDCAALAAGSAGHGSDGLGSAMDSESEDDADPVRDEDLDWLFDRAMQPQNTAAAQVPAAQIPAAQIPATQIPAGSREGTVIAIGGVLAACLATWLCIATIDAGTKDEQRKLLAFVEGFSRGELASSAMVPIGESLEMPRPGMPGGDGSSRTGMALVGGSGDGNSRAGDSRDIDSERSSKSSLVGSPAGDSVPHANKPADSYKSLASSMHAARNRDLPEQRTARATDLSHRVNDRTLRIPERLAAAQRLLRATRAGSSAARHATDQLLLALAGCGDLDQDEVALHEQLLDEVRSNGPVLVRLEHRLVSLPSRNHNRSRLGHSSSLLNHDELAAIMVATRVENSRLDQALRRALRRNDAIADVIASALRCGVRAEGSAQLLLNCWHDQVAIGKQENTSKWAEFWFRGQAANSFAQLSSVHATSHSAPERIRCLLAMGCVHDKSTLKTLLAGLAAPRRIEACAAACGIATLPHHVLKLLLPKAKLQNAGLLRAALARAGMPEANRWIQNLALSKPRLRLMRTGPITRFSEVAAWFQNAIRTAD